MIKVPILIIGFERSGTTLLRRLMSMHPDLEHDIVHEKKKLFFSCSGRSDAEAKLTYAARQEGEKTGAVMSIKTGIKLPYRSASEAKRIVGKFMELYGKDVKIIHIVRDPIEAINSQVRTFNRKPGACIDEYFEAVPKTRDYVDNLGGEYVHYDDLVRRTRQTLDRLYKYIGARKITPAEYKKITTTKDPWVSDNGRVMPGLRYFSKVGPTNPKLVLSRKHTAEIRRRAGSE